MSWISSPELASARRALRRYRLGSARRPISAGFGNVSFSKFNYILNFPRGAVPAVVLCGNQWAGHGIRCGGRHMVPAPPTVSAVRAPSVRDGWTRTWPNSRIRYRSLAPSHHMGDGSGSRAPTPTARRN